MTVLRQLRRTKITKERRGPTPVLIVNDDARACAFLQRMVASAGYQATGATTFEAALLKISQTLPRCVVLDMASKGGSGGSSLNLLEQLRTNPDPRVSSARAVLCTTSAKNRSFSFESGADGFMVHPFHLDELLAHIADVVARPQKDRAQHRRDEIDRPYPDQESVKFSQ